jgi:hypothetical protein
MKELKGKDNILPKLMATPSSGGLAGRSPTRLGVAVRAAGGVASRAAFPQTPQTAPPAAQR